MTRSRPGDRRLIEPKRALINNKPGWDTIDLCFCWERGCTNRQEIIDVGGTKGAFMIYQ
jgi:hypothetical protein